LRAQSAVQFARAAARPLAAEVTAHLGDLAAEGLRQRHDRSAGTNRTGS
jgi:hypothetical protein